MIIDAALIAKLEALKVSDDRTGLKQNATIELCIKTVKAHFKERGYHYDERDYPLAKQTFEEFNGKKIGG